jgi:glycosyltransferase involved in cell wall biosynthesis
VKVNLLLPKEASAITEREFLTSCAACGIESGCVSRWSGGFEDGVQPIAAINAALRGAMSRKADLLIIGGGVELLPGSLEALFRAAQGDPMILALAPRSNVGAVTGFPHSPKEVDHSDCPRIVGVLRKHFLPVSYVPLHTSPCLYLKTIFLNDIGILDEAYLRWENALDDLLMRANRYGYSTVAVNHAYTWINSLPTPECREDKALLEERYPEVKVSLKRYYASAERQAEKVYTGLIRIGKPLIAFDFSSFALNHDGTNEAGINILKAAVNICAYCDFAVIASQELWEAHRLYTIPHLRRLEIHDKNAKATAILRIGQPWKAEEVRRLFFTAPVVSIFMLDTIGFDCRYIAAMGEDLDLIWSFTCRHADIIFTQSEFTRNRLCERFMIGNDTLLFLSRHSLDLMEYSQEISLERKHILIIGNRLHHKFVLETAAALAPRFSDKIFALVGLKEIVHQNVAAFPAGQFDDEAFSRLYLDAECVIFPSTYEGFGFPILHSLARGKVVYVRDTELNRELYQRVRYRQNIRFFTSLDELAARLRTDDHIFSFDDDEGGETQGWKRSALEILAALEKKIAVVDFARVADRLRWCEALFGNKEG